jgi:hypothetical protein
MKRLSIIAIPAISLLLSACASVPMASFDLDARAKSFEHQPDKSVLYIYRNETLGSAVKMDLILDGNNLGQTVAHSYFAVPVAPGTHRLVSKAENDDTLDFSTEAGQNYFVWQEVKMGMLSARTGLHLVGDQEGMTGVRDSKMIASTLALPQPNYQGTPATPEVASQPASAAVVLAPAPAAETAQPAETSSLVPASNPAPAVVATASPAPAGNLQKVAFRSGTSSVTVERLAKQNNCTGGRGAGLLTAPGPVEMYRMDCDEGGSFTARCELRQCQPAQ